MRRLWTHHRTLLLAFAVFLGLAIFFGVGAFRKARDFDAEKEQPIAAWMTPRYVAHSWDMPRDAMMEILGLEPPPPGRQTLEDIAADKGIPVEDYIREIEKGIAAFRAAHGQ